MEFLELNDKNKPAEKMEPQKIGIKITRRFNSFHSNVQNGYWTKSTGKIDIKMSSEKLALCNKTEVMTHFPDKYTFIA